MNLHGFADVGRFRVRLPTPLYPYKGRECIDACMDVGSSERSSGWLGLRDLGEFFPAKFSEKNPLNIPGPIYGGETDTCLTGPHEAPGNVLVDQHGCEFVFKQAASATEFRDLISAAMCECYQGYGADGDEHWRLSTIREWWGTRGDMLREGVGHEWCSPEAVESWTRALKGQSLGYLRVYAYFVENGRVPLVGDPLPVIQ